MLPQPFIQTRRVKLMTAKRQLTQSIAVYKFVQAYRAGVIAIVELRSITRISKGYNRNSRNHILRRTPERFYPPVTRTTKGKRQFWISSDLSRAKRTHPCQLSVLNYSFRERYEHADEQTENHH